MTEQAADAVRTRSDALPLLVGMAVYAVLLFAAHRLLSDPDTYWQIMVGQWMVDNRTVPVSDIYSFTMRGEPWHSTQWLSQVAYSQVFAWWGWDGVLILTALGAAAAFALLARFLLRRLDEVAVMILLPLAFVIALPHFFARPHVLALPVMVAFAALLLSAAERGQAPRLPTAALIALWANLHGSFVFGLMLIGPIALDAVLNAAPPLRRRVLLQWFVFGVVALAAACVTPYGWHSLTAARGILGLGEALSLIREWQPANFGSMRVLEVGVLLILALALFNGLRLPLMRVALFVGLLYMMLAHVRNVDVFAFLAPMVVAAPMAAQFVRYARKPDSGVRRRGGIVAGGAALVLALTAGVVLIGHSRPPASLAPAAAVAALKQHGAARVFNTYNFGGYLIAQGVPVFVDGRAELYGAAFLLRYDGAVRLRRPADLFELLDAYRIDATLLSPKAPAARLLDHMGGWRKIYVDNVAVVHVRDADAPAAREPPVGAAAE